MAATERPYPSVPTNLIYLDHAATTPVDARVLDRMLPYFTEHFGNPSSVHEPGREARAAIDWARGTVARILNCGPREIVFTSGATEANNLAIKGLALAALHRAGAVPPHIITSAIEHPAVLQTVQELARFGVSSTIVPVNDVGLVDPRDVAAAVRPETCLVSIMYANNEIGTVQPISEISANTRSAGVSLHSDAVQAAGKLPLDVASLGVDLLSLSAHKLNGPKGVGLLFVREGTDLFPQLHGGGQEYGHRAGTENVAGIVGLATALEIAVREQDASLRRMSTLRDRLADELMERVPGAQLNGDWQHRLANNVHISFEHVDGESLLFHLDLHGLAASSGSACASGSGKPSHVLLALGLTEAQAEGSLRLTLGPGTTEAQINRAVEIIVAAVEQIRSFSATGWD
jgi:cysteine desulfurase